MIPASLSQLGQQLRQAAARRAYADVERLAAAAGRAAAAEVEALPAGDAATGEIAAWLAKLYRDTEILVRIGRAMQCDELRRISFLRQYLPTQDSRASHVKLAL